MKTVSLLLTLVIAMCLTGCENTELVNCQQEKDTLQGQLDQANATVAEKDKEIEELKTKNIEDQNKAMEAVTTMMTKQAAADKKLKESLEVKTQEVKELQAKVAVLEAKIADNDDDDGNEDCDDEDDDDGENDE